MPIFTGIQFKIGMAYRKLISLKMGETQHIFKLLPLHQQSVGINHTILQKLQLKKKWCITFNQKGDNLLQDQFQTLTRVRINYMYQFVLIFMFLNNKVHHNEQCLLLRMRRANLYWLYLGLKTSYCDNSQKLKEGINWSCVLQSDVHQIIWLLICFNQ